MLDPPICEPFHHECFYVTHRLFGLSKSISPDFPEIISFIIGFIRLENNTEDWKTNNCKEISKLIKAFPKDIAALDKRIVLAKFNSQGSGR